MNRARGCQNHLAALGPRPRMTLVICEAQVAEIWVNRRAPLITIRDYDWGETERAPNYDCDGFAYTKINWRRPAWALGLSLNPPLQGNVPSILPTQGLP